ncbi:MAG: hypothetical protein NTZ65_04380 [Candidatus Berkelbacteria bacterium]|nr:hypothetical protein [Candidatus Berkelbacteria bacterium]
MKERLRYFPAFFGQYFVYLLIVFIGASVFFNFYSKGPIKRARALPEGASSSGSLLVTKRILKGTQENATFEAGERVNVELTVYEPSSSRKDYTIEDIVPATALNDSGLITFKPADGEPRPITGFTVPDGKITIVGNKEGSNIELKKGKNTFTYSFNLTP